MARLEDITVGSSVKGIVSADTVTVIHVEWYGTNVIAVAYKDSNGNLVYGVRHHMHEFFYRQDPHRAGTISWLRFEPDRRMA